MAFDGTLTFGTAIDTGGFQSGISGLGDLAKTGFSVVSGAISGVTAAAGAAVSGISALSGVLLEASGSAAEYGDNIDKMSQKIGMSAQAYQEWDFILQHSGTSIDAMTQGMKTLSNAVVDQSDASVAAFSKLGISMEKAASLSQEELFAEVVAALQEIPASAERTALANDLLGRSAMELGALLNTSAEDTELMRQQVHALGGVMSDEAVKAAAAYQDSLQNLNTAADGLKRGLASELMPAVTEMMDGLSAVLSGDLTGVDVLVSGLDSLTDDLGGIFERIAETGETLLPQLAAGIEQALPRVFEAGSGILETLLSSVLSVLPVALTSLSGVGDAFLGGLATALTGALPELLTAGSSAMELLGGALLTGLTDNLGGIFTRLNAIGETLLPQLTAGIVQALPMLSEAGSGILETLLNAAFALLPPVLASLSGIGRTLVTVLVTALRKYLPDILKSGTDLVEQLGGALLGNAPVLLDAALSLVMGLVEALADPQGLTTLLDAAVNIVTELAELLGENISPLLSAALLIVQTLGTALINCLPELLTAAISLVTAIVNAVLENTDQLGDAAIAIITALADTLTDGANMSALAGAVGALLTTLFTVLTDVSRIEENASDFTDKLISSLGETLGGKDWAALGTSVINAFFTGLLGVDFDFYEFLDSFQENWDAGFAELFPELAATGEDVFTWLMDGLGKFGTQIADFVGNFSSTLGEFISNIDWAALGTAMLEGIVSGLTGTDFDIHSFLSGFGKNLVSDTQGVFDINSPSKVMRDEVGKYLALGIGEGFTDYLPDVGSDVRDAFSALADAVPDVIRAPELEQIGTFGDLEISVDTAAIRALRQMQITPELYTGGLALPDPVMPDGMEIALDAPELPDAITVRVDTDALRALMELMAAPTPDRGAGSLILTPPDMDTETLAAVQDSITALAAERYLQPQAAQSYVTNHYAGSSYTTINNQNGAAADDPREGVPVRDIIVPVSIGGEEVQTLVINAVRDANAVSGGVTV